MEEGYEQGITEEVNEFNGAREIYTTSTEVGTGPVRCRGGLAGASIRDMEIGLLRSSLIPGSDKGPPRYKWLPTFGSTLEC